ncbi:MAG TPA: hypothetical protein PKN28_06435, partial [Clostridiales bacterium]|nr:hypothetical protein [Clostridiales bacterium]
FVHKVTPLIQYFNSIYINDIGCSFHFNFLFPSQRSGYKTGALTFIIKRKKILTNRYGHGILSAVKANLFTNISDGCDYCGEEFGSNFTA